jgi:hypothetical protein
MRAGRMIASGAAAALLAVVGHGAAAWYRYGRVKVGAGNDELLDRFMPSYEVRECHQVRVAAPADVTFAVARELGLSRSPLVRVIFRGRELLMGSTGKRDEAPSRALLEEVLSLGWRTLAEEAGREIVVGAVTQPWRADVVFRGIPPEAFAAFDEPDYAKIAWTLAAVPLGPGASVFRTETRVATTSPSARTRFRRYWAMVSPGVLLIRREMLRMVRREAERRAQASSCPADRTS